ncbi:ATP-binding protein [Amycolatopsis sp. H6(2020)]|nr:ATP-binding protein [Amycolatopsis sp. H6(2020)]
MLSAEIARDLPDYTVHDVTHLEALWETAELVAGEDYPLSPLEGFILGCAFLVHDLAMTKAAYPEGIESVIGADRWKDTLFVKFKEICGGPPTAEELASPPEHVVKAAESDLLRELHAEQAVRLLGQAFGTNEYYLIEDPDLRKTYGELIGRVAASHWWPIGKVASEFTSVFGSPGTFPKDWMVDPLKLACLVRAADASHIDSRRAPGFLLAIRNVSGYSRSHWVFQERLQRPRLEGDRLVYTAPQPFPPEDSESWWVCIETLRMVDVELRAVDALLADNDRPRFEARSVGHVGDLEHLARLIPVRDWFPVDARVKIGNVVALVERLGGAQLYGENPRVAVRELISNAADAIRARRALTGASGSELRLRVQVRLRREGDRTWLHIRDNGIGMTKEIMSGPLLDFGESYWHNPAALRDLPGLVSSGFAPTGKFGIGFFAAFMLGSNLKVISRRFNRGEDDTYVLTFDNGLGSRPLLRKAQVDERLEFGGTDISIEISDKIRRQLLGFEFSLSGLISGLCPSIDVNIDLVEDGRDPEPVIRENDWRELPDSEFLARLYSHQNFSDLLGRVRPLLDSSGAVVGRGVIVGVRRYHPLISGVITIGGLRAESELHTIAGIFLGDTSRAARDEAFPLATSEAVSRWATEQVALYLSESPDRDEWQLGFASVACALGGDITNLAVADSAEGLLTLAEVYEWASEREKVLLANDDSLFLEIEDQELYFEIDDDVLVVANHEPGFYRTSRLYSSSLRQPWEELRARSVRKLCIDAVAAAWRERYGFIVDSNGGYSGFEKVGSLRNVTPVRLHVEKLQRTASG